MERTASLLSLSSGGSSRSGLDSKNSEPLLPFSEKPPRQTVPRIKAVLSHCLYKRLLVWTLAGLVLITLVFSQSRHVSVSNVVQYAKSKGYKATTSPNNSGNKSQEASQDLSDTTIIVNVQYGTQSQKPTIDHQADALNQEEDAKEREEFEKEAQDKPWLRFPQ